MESSGQSFTTLELINKLLIEFRKVDSNLAEISTFELKKKVSQTLKGSQFFLKHIISRITNSNQIKCYNPHYKFSIELLDLFKQKIYKKYGKSAKNCYELINRYLRLNENLKVYSKQQYHYHNPSLDSRFFAQINSVEKGYWLGFLLADGSITLGDDDKLRYQIAIELSDKDKDQIFRFCAAVGLSIDKVSSRKREIDGTFYNMVYVQFTCKEMVGDLKNLGFFEFKAGDILSCLYDFLPDIQKAIILGYFDGDGMEGTSKIATTNIKFLHQLKEYFNIKYEILTKIDITEDYIENNPIKPTKNLFSLSFGASFFNDLLDNYPSSMKRKRIYLDIYRDIYDNLKEVVGNRERLQKLVNTFPKVWLAKKFRVNEKTLHKLCSEWNIKSYKRWTLKKLEEARLKFESFKEDF